MTAEELARVGVDYRNAQRDFERLETCHSFLAYTKAQQKFDRCVAAVLEQQQENP